MLLKICEMKILLVHNYYRFKGGEEVYVNNLASLLRKKGHKVLLWTKDSRKVGSLGMRIKVALNMFWNRQANKEFALVINRFKPDLIHFNNIFPLITPSIYYVAKKLKVPIVQTVHNFRYMFPKSILFRRGIECPVCLNRSLVFPAPFHACYRESIAYTVPFSLSHMFHYLMGSFNLVDAFVFPSGFIKRYFQKNSGLDSFKFHLVRNVAGFENGPRLSKEKGDNFIFVGRLSNEKGIMEILEIFARHPEMKLIVLGDGPLRKEVLKYKKYKNIEILGYLPGRKVFSMLKKASFTIIPSKWHEVMPTVLAESFAAGTGVIVPKFGVFKELVKKGKTGMFYRQKDMISLENILTRTSGNKKLAYYLGNNSYKEYKSYTKESFYNRLFEVYSKLVK